MTSYILTTEYNDFDQHGEYFVAWFHKEPSPDELRQTLIREMETDSCELCYHLLATGGGRRMKCREDEYQWFHLRQISSANKSEL